MIVVFYTFPYLAKYKCQHSNFPGPWNPAGLQEAFPRDWSQFYEIEALPFCPGEATDFKCNPWEGPGSFGRITGGGLMLKCSGLMTGTIGGETYRKERLGSSLFPGLAVGGPRLAQHKYSASFPWHREAWFLTAWTEYSFYLARRCHKGSWTEQSWILEGWPWRKDPHGEGAWMSQHYLLSPGVVFYFGELSVTLPQP